MPLSPGTRLGPYEVVAPIGSGGMGEVYRATDLNLKRAVAIKVLPASVGEDRERIARFQREAELLAALNHPNIAQIYGLEKSDGVNALVMELVDGVTLAEVIDGAVDFAPSGSEARRAAGVGPRGKSMKDGLSLSAALAIARQLTDALEAAHGLGIIHRDLKPSNICVRPDGTVKVLDFGLAKALGPEGASATAGDVANSPTITSPAQTQAGMILGTAAYMSPEQARGRATDRRADIWAFGCVLFEMLSGHRVFDDEDNSLTLSRVLQREPPWEKLPADVPSRIRRVLELCLQKDLKQRMGDIHDVRLALDGAFETAAPPIAVGERAGSLGWHRTALLIGAAVGLGASAAATAVWIAMRPDSPPVTRLAISTSGATVLARGGGSRDLAITPDGARIAYRGANQIVVRALGDLQPTSLSGVGAAASPFISPDGAWVGFSTLGQLKKVAITGGAPVPLTSLDGLIRGATWSEGNTIVYATANLTTGLARVGADGGDAVAVTTPDQARGEEDHLWPEFLPDGRTVVFTITASNGGFDAGRIALVDINTREQITLPLRGSQARYVRSGHLMYAAAGALHAVGFDLASRAVVGTPVVVITPAPLTGSGGLQLDVAANGTLVYLPQPSGGVGRRTIVWVDRKGQETPIDVPPRPYRFPSLSADGTRVVVSDDVQGADLWVLNVSPPTMYRATDHPGNDQGAAWMPDGRLLFSSSRSGTHSLHVQSLGGGGEATRLLKGDNLQFGPRITPDGAGVVFTEVTSTGSGDIKLHTFKTGDVTSLVATRFEERGGTVSPDGRWLVYESNQSGRFEVYVQPFPAVGGVNVVPVSATGGVQARWGPGGKELFYVAPDGALMSIVVQARGSLWAAGTPSRLIDGPYATRTDQRGSITPQYDTIDGQRFLMLKEGTPDADPPASPEIIVVQHWFEELKRAVPVK